MCPLFRQLFEVRPFLLLWFFFGAQQRRLNAQLLQLIHQISVLVHLEQDVAASDKLAIEVDLRDRGPVGEFFDSCGGQMALVLRVTQIASNQNIIRFLTKRIKTGFSHFSVYCSSKKRAFGKQEVMNFSFTLSSWNTTLQKYHQTHHVGRKLPEAILTSLLPLRLH